MYFRHIKLILSLGSLVYLGIVTDCSYQRNSKTKEASANQVNHSNEQENDQKDSINIPKGDEIKITIKVISSKKAVFTIMNSSAETVHLPFLSGDKNGYAYFVNFELEKQGEKADEWKPLSQGDFGSGFHPLNSREFFKGRIQVMEEGTYRIKINYMIDTKIYEQIDKISKTNDIKERLTEYDKIDKERNLSIKKITSNPFRF